MADAPVSLDIKVQTVTKVSCSAVIRKTLPVCYLHCSPCHVPCLTYVYLILSLTHVTRCFRLSLCSHKLTHLFPDSSLSIYAAVSMCSLTVCHMFCWAVLQTVASFVLSFFYYLMSRLWTFSPVLFFRVTCVCGSELSAERSLYGGSSDWKAGVSVFTWLPEVRRSMFMWVFRKITIVFCVQKCEHLKSTLFPVYWCPGSTHNASVSCTRVQNGVPTLKVFLSKKNRS